MFEPILKELKTKYKDLGLSENYLKVVAKRLARTVKEESEISEAVAEVEDEVKFQQSQDDAVRTLKKKLKDFEEVGKQEAKEEPHSILSDNRVLQWGYLFLYLKEIMRDIFYSHFTGMSLNTAICSCLA
ncbi:MAG: hypothetical protein Q4A00_07905 [Flavobacteriaceae bacterium]|nr:hypothetical protein [Flavobacteriaceae bacterium]